MKTRFALLLIASTSAINRSPLIVSSGCCVK